MALGDDVVNAILNPQTADIERLRRRLNKIDGDSLVLGDMITDAGGLNVPSIRAGTGEFGIQPLGTIILRRTTDQTLTNDTATPVSFDNVWMTTGDTFRLDPSDATKIKMSKKGRGIMVAGKANFAANGTGYRRVVVSVFDAAAGQTFSGTMAQVVPLSADGSVVPFMHPYPFNAGTDDDYLQIIVRQTSGGDLALQFLTVAIYLIV